MGAPKKSGPPVALLVGGGCGALAVLGVIILVIVLVAGGGGDDEPVAEKPDDDSSSSSGDSGDSGDSGGDVMAGSVYKRVPSTNVAVPVPPGWREDRRSLYTFALSGDGDALLAFTTVSSYGEWAGRTQHAINVFNVTGCTWKDPIRANIGPNQLRSRIRDGQCSFNGIPAAVSTVLVESGRRAHPFIVYAVANKASDRTTKQAQQCVLQMKLDQ